VRDVRTQVEEVMSKRTRRVTAKKKLPPCEFPWDGRAEILEAVTMNFEPVVPHCDLCKRMGYLNCHIHKEENLKRLDAADGIVSSTLRITKEK